MRPPRPDSGPSGTESMQRDEHADGVTKTDDEASSSEVALDVVGGDNGDGSEDYLPSPIERAVRWIAEV